MTVDHHRFSKLFLSKSPIHRKAANPSQNHQVIAKDQRGINQKLKKTGKDRVKQIWTLILRFGERIIKDKSNDC